MRSYAPSLGTRPAPGYKEKKYTSYARNQSKGLSCKQSSLRHERLVGVSYHFVERLGLFEEKKTTEEITENIDLSQSHTT